MPSLVWSDALSLSMPVMDATHQEFVDLLATVEASDDAHLLGHWQALIAHTQEHFDREDQWMQDTGFAPGNCHSSQHAVVLKVLREGEAKGAEGELAFIRQLTHELTLWFPHHAQNMDFGLALHLKSLGFDPKTGLSEAASQHLPAQPITGCGGACGTPAGADAEASSPA
jgi:hemerythrin-like metal-binding protein